MTAHLTLTMEFPNRLIAGLRADCDRTSKEQSMRAIMTEMRGMLGRTYNNIGMARACIASACASTTVTCAYASAVSGTDKLTVAGTDLTAYTSPSGSAQFAIGSSNAAMATALAACINANATTQKLVRATSSGAVVTITCVYPGPIGNLVTLAETGNSMTLGAAALANGSSDEVDEYQFGYTPAT